ncbi:flavodoxin family protein [Actinokineospora sp. HUAS TT18]|uniref:flavodoxin family protein n=1 Tax=Actinokineospora sp. HUAS TT18 TaxID=3447451 RepID=UPI003F5247A6
MSRRFLFLLASTRRDGNTEHLARRAAAGLPEGTEVEWLSFLDHPLPPFEDIRHDGDGVYPALEGDAKLLFDATVAATDIVIASPLYWYTVSTSTKLYLDHWSGWFRIPGADFRARMAGKTLWSVTAHSSDDTSYADGLVTTLRLSADYMNMTWGGALLGFGNRPGDVLTDTAALTDASTFFTDELSRVGETHPA